VSAQIAGVKSAKRNSKAKMPDFVISTSIDASGVRKGADETRRAFSSLASDSRRQVEQLQRSMKGLDDGSIQKFARNIQKSMAEAGRSGTDYMNILRRFRPELDALADNLKKGSLSQEDYNRRLKALPPIMQTAIAESRKLGREIHGIGEETNKASQQFEKLKNAGTSIQNFGSQVSGVGRQLTIGLTAPIVGIGVAAIKSFSDVESAVAEISTIKPTINSSEVFTALNEMSTRVPKLAGELGGGLYNIFSSINVNQAEGLRLLEIFGKGATAAKTETEAFGTAVLGVLNAYKLGVDQAEHVSDVFFNTVNLGVVNGRELSNELGLVTQAAKNAGVSFDELGALIVGVTKEGGTASQNINNLYNLLSKITTKESMDALKDGLNIDVQIGGKFRPILDVLGDLKVKLDALPPAARALQLQKIFPDGQARTGAQTLLSQLDAVKEALEVNKTTAGAAEAAYQKIAATTAVQFSLLKNSAIAIMAELGSAILPILQPVIMWIAKTLVPAVRSAVESFKTWSPTMKTVAVAVAGILAAIGPFLIALGAVISFVGATVAGIMSFVSGWAALTAAAAAAGGVLALVGGFITVTLIPALKIIIPVFLAIAAVMAVVIAAGAALYAAWRINFGGIRDYTMAAYNAIKSIVITVMNTVLSVVRSAGGAMVAWWKENYPAIRQVVETVSIAIKTTIGNFLKAVEQFWNAHGSRIMAYVTTYLGYVKSIFTQVVNQLGTVLRFGLQIMTGNWEGAWQSFLKILQNGSRLAATALRAGMDLIIRIIAALVPIMTQYGRQFTETLLLWIGKAMVGAAYIIATLPVQLARLVPKFILAGRSIASAIWQGIKEGLAGVDKMPSILGGLAGSKNLTQPSAALGAVGGGPAIDTASLAGAKMPSLSGGSGGKSAAAKKPFELGARAKAIMEMADRLGVSALDLATIISYETGGTFSTSKWGGKGGDYLGLFQFGAEERKKYGVKAGQPFDDQLRAGERFLLDRFAGVGRSTQGATILDLYKTFNGGNPGKSGNASDGNGTINEHVAKMIRDNRPQALKTLWGGEKSNLTSNEVELPKTFEQLADENLYNAAKQRVQDLITLSRELGIALTVPAEVTTSNQDLILKQRIEFKNLTDLRDAREKVTDQYIKLKPILNQLGKSEGDYSTKTLADADRSLKQLASMEDLKLFADSELDRTTKELRELKAGLGETLTPLQTFDRTLEMLAQAAGVSVEAIKQAIPKFAEIRKNIEETGKLNFAETIKKQAKEASAAIGELARNYERELAGMKDKTPGITEFFKSLEGMEGLKLSSLKEMNQFVTSTNEIDVAKLTTFVRGWLTILAGFGQFDASQIDVVIEKITAAANGLNQLKGANLAKAAGEYRGGLAEELAALQRAGQELTRYELAQREILKNYKDLSSAEKEQILNLAAQVDAQAELNESYNRFYGFVSDSLHTLADEGFGGLFKSIARKFKDMLIDMAAQWITSKIFGLLNGGTGQSGGTGGGFGGILSAIGGLFGIGGNRSSGGTASSGGRGNMTTPSFNPNAYAGGSIGTGANDPFSAVFNGAFDNNAWANGQAIGTSSSAATGGFLASLKGLFSPVKNVLNGGKPSAMAGTLSGIGMLASLAGSLIGGKVGGVLSMAGTGMGIGAMFGPWGAVAGAAIGAIVGLFQGDPKKKIDKKENLPKLQQGFTDALGQLRSLLSDRNALSNDPDGALQKAQELRMQIASGFGIQFQSKKYKAVAQTQITAKLAEADQIIKQLKELASGYGFAKTIDDRLQTSFASGVSISPDFMKQYSRFKRRNGMLAGAWNGRDTLPSMLAPGEMVLNPMQIGRVRANAGFDAFKHAGIPHYAAGVSLAPPPGAPMRNDGAPANRQTGPISVQIVLNNSGMVESDIQSILVDGIKQPEVQVEIVKAYNKGKARTRGK
jgi:TP901 family phage tail tape measure protein